MTFELFYQGKVHLIEFLQIIDHNVPHFVCVLNTHRKSHISHVTELRYFDVQVNKVDLLLFYHQK